MGSRSSLAPGLCSQLPIFRDDQFDPVSVLAGGHDGQCIGYTPLTPVPRCPLLQIAFVSPGHTRPIPLASTSDALNQNSLEVAFRSIFRLPALAFPSPVSLSYALLEPLSGLLLEKFYAEPKDICWGFRCVTIVAPRFKLISSSHQHLWKFHGSDSQMFLFSSKLYIVPVALH